MAENEQLNNQEQENNNNFPQDREKIKKSISKLNPENISLLTATLDTTLPDKNKYINSKLDELQQKFA